MRQGATEAAPVSLTQPHLSQYLVDLITSINNFHSHSDEMFRQLERQLDKTESLVELLAKRMNGMPMESTSTDHHVDLPPISIGGFFPLHFIPSELDSSAPPPLPPSDNQSTVQLPELPDLTSLETQTTQGLIRNN